MLHRKYINDIAIIYVLFRHTDDVHSKGGETMYVNIWDENTVLIEWDEDGDSDSDDDE